MINMDKEKFLKFLRETKRARPNPKSQIGHIQLLERFLQEEKDGRPLDEGCWAQMVSNGSRHFWCSSDLFWTHVSRQPD